MYNKYEGTAKFDKTGDDGIIITVSESYLIDALSFTEAEERLTREMKPFISGEFLISKLQRRNIAEMFFSDNAEADKWYRCKVAFVTLDEEKGVEKRVFSTMYVQATDMKDALGGLIKGMAATLADYEITSMNETKILDVFQYEAADGGNEKE